MSHEVGRLNAYWDGCFFFKFLSLFGEAHYDFEWGSILFMKGPPVHVAGHSRPSPVQRPFWGYVKYPFTVYRTWEIILSCGYRSLNCQVLTIIQFNQNAQFMGCDLSNNGNQKCYSYCLKMFSMITWSL